MILRNVLAIAIFSVLSSSGLSCMATESQDKTEWFVRPKSPEFPKTFGAHYTTDLHRYPGYGLVVWNYDANRYRDQAGVSAQIMAAARRCRQDFSRAYFSGEIVVYDADGSFRNDWLADKPNIIRFEPNYLVILLRDVSPEGKYKPQGSEFYNAGVVVRASDVFNDTVSLADVVRHGFTSKRVCHVDPSPALPEYALIYDIIERFRVSRDRIMFSSREQP